MGQSPARILIKFRSGTQALAEARAGVSRVLMESRTLAEPPLAGTRVASTLSASGVIRLRAVKPDAGLEPLPAGIERLFIADVGPDASGAQAVRALASNQDVEYVEPDAVARITGSAAPLIPNDSYFSYQWALQNTGQTLILGSKSITGTAGADINAPAAWDILTGSANIVLAVLDSGIAASHPEFAGRLVAGVNFVGTSTEDDNGHGTAVASVAAATGGNGQLMAGVDWNCKIMPVKVIDAQGNAPYTAIIQGLTYAADNGAKVINLSLAGTVASSSLQDAVTYANGKGAVIVASMGNDNVDTSYYPAAYSTVIAVGATNSKDQRAVPFSCTDSGGSNYGSKIDFVAPGDVLVALSNTNPTAITAWCGTSVAAPMVSGTVTLMLSVNPALTFDQVYSALKTGARDQVGLTSEDTQGWDEYFGWGRIDAYRSLIAATGTNLFSQIAVGGGYTTVFTFLNTGSVDVNATLTLTGTDGNPLVASIAGPSGAGTQVSSLQFTVPPGGTQYLTATSASGVTQTGWAKTTTAGGLVGGAATFSFAPGGSAIQTVAGVMTSSAVSAATIPVDDDVDVSKIHCNRCTGYAVANPGTSSITIKVVTVNTDGTIGATLSPISLAAGNQTASFIYQDPNASPKFRGSVVFIGEDGAVFSAVALVMNKGLFTAIPVIPSKAPNIK